MSKFVKCSNDYLLKSIGHNLIINAKVQQQLTFEMKDILPELGKDKY